MSIFKKRFEIYKISDGEKVFNLTNSNKFVTHEGVVFEPAAIDRDKIELRDDMEKQKLTITINLDHPIAQYYLMQSIESTATLRVFENYDGEFYSLWRGRLTSVSVNENDFGMVFDNGSTKMLRSGAYRRYQRTCPYALYGKSCKVDKDQFAVESYVKGLIGQVMTLSTTEKYDKDYFSGGMALNPFGALRFITKNEESVLNETSLLYETKVTLFNSFYGEDLKVDDKIILYAGCDKLNKTCSSKFGNIANFGGFPFIPDDNPFVGTII